MAHPGGPAAGVASIRQAWDAVAAGQTLAAAAASHPELGRSHGEVRVTPRYGWYGDDFTGATDTLATLAGAGLRAMLFLGVPQARHLSRAGGLDAVGIAGAARTMDPAAMRRELDPVGRFFAGLGVPVLHYKCCSTFDSAPEVGSIGAAIATLRAHRPNPFVPIVGGQPNIGRYCAFSTLFARAGADGAVIRLDRHPTMSVHPVTPMQEADLRLHLQAQGCSPVVGIHLPSYEQPGEVEPAVEAAMGAGIGAAAVLFDLASPGQLGPIGAAIWRRAERQPLLAVGPSSVAQALAACWTGTSVPQAPALGPSDGPVLVLAGSLSPGDTAPGGGSSPVRARRDRCGPPGRRGRGALLPG